MTNAQSPEEIARSWGLPHQRALIDLDLGDPIPQVVGADPMDLSNIPMEPVKSIITTTSVITIMAHQGEGQKLADILAGRPEMLSAAADHAGGYITEGVLDFALHALTPEQIRNVERNTSRRILE